MFKEAQTVRNRKKRKGHIMDVSKPCELLKTSWKVQAKLFFQHSTLHGVRYIAEEGRPIIEKYVHMITCNFFVIFSKGKMSINSSSCSKLDFEK